MSKMAGFENPVCDIKFLTEDSTGFENMTQYYQILDANDLQDFGIRVADMGNKLYAFMKIEGTNSFIVWGALNGINTYENVPMQKIDK